MKHRATTLSLFLLVSASLVACAAETPIAGDAEAAKHGFEAADVRVIHEEDSAGFIFRQFDLAVAPDSASWISESTLRDAYRRLGIEAEQPVIVHCRTGHQASQTYFLLKHVLGYRDVRWFDASWMTWAARSELPAEAGP